MSYRKFLFLLTVMVLFPLLGRAQSIPEKEYQACINELNARCPIEHPDGWALLTFTDQGDTTRVELLYPSLLKGFLPALTGNAQNVRNLWVRQMRMFGDDWKSFVRLMLAARRTLVIDFTMGDGDPAASITFQREDFD